MVLVKLYRNSNQETFVQVAADSLKSLKKNAEEKLNVKIRKFLNKQDKCEIDDEDVFAEELALAIKKNEKLEIIAIESSSESDDDSSFTRFKSSSEDEKNKKKPDSKRSENLDLNDSEIQTLLELKKLLNNEKKTDLAASLLAASVTKSNDSTISRTNSFASMIGPKKDETTSRYKSTTTAARTTEMSTKYEEKLKKELERENEKLKKQNERKERIEKLKDEITNVRKQTNVDLSKTEEQELVKKLARTKLRQHHINKLFEELKEAEKVDLCFMLDCTGSMASYIKEAVNTINKIIESLAKKFQDFQLRFSFVGYRDHSDGADRVVVLNFSDNKNKFNTFVNAIAAIGGADECEDVFGGLEAVTKLDWQHTTRVLFHIGDAPCHGTRFYISANDSYPLGDPRGLDITDLLRKFVNLNIAYYFAEINTSTVKMIDEFNNELKALNGEEIRKVMLKSAVDMTKTITTAITRSIMDSKSMSMGETRGKRKITLDLVKTINWNLDSLTEHKATVLLIDFKATIKDLKNAEITYNEIDAKVYKAKNPFAKGSLRYATTAIIKTSDPTFSTSNKYVLKESIFEDPEYYSLDYVKQSVEPHLFASFLADQFKKVCKSQKSLKFTKICIVRLHDLKRYYTAEEYFGEEFHKWSNNAGFVDEDKYSATLNSFAHWTFDATGTYLIVTDLQGAKRGNEFILTDPAITCPLELDRFTRTNLAMKGLKKFFETHQCNHMCKHLRLTKHDSQKMSDREDTHSMTQWNV